MAMKILGETFYSATEVAELLGVTRRTITTWISKGRIQGQKIGKRWYFAESNVKAFLMGRKPLD